MDLFDRLYIIGSFRAIQADQYKRTQEQFRQTDNRIGKLVSAIGELSQRAKD